MLLPSALLTLNDPINMPIDLKESGRRPKPANIRITSRDLRILLSIAQNQFLATSQINSLHFPSIHRTRKRLRQLLENKYVARLKIPPGLETLSSESVYSINRAGLQLLQLRGIIHETVSIPKVHRRPGALLFLSHTLMRNSFRIALERAVKTNSQIFLNIWRHDSAITQYVSLPDSKTQSVRRVALKADAHFGLERDSRGCECYLEVDNGTMALTRLITKMNAYHKWHLSSRQATYGKSIRRRFLILTFSKRRAKNIADKMTGLARTGLSYNPWLVAYVERTELIQTNVLTGLSWYQPTPSGLREVTLDQEMSQIVARQKGQHEIYL